MSKKHRKISLIFIGFLLALLTIVSFAEPPVAPNQLITENPYKEVKTVEVNKNREHAEMNIGVNKLNPKVLNGYKLSDTEYYIELPSEEILKQNETYYISKTLEDLPDIYSVNGKKTIVNLNKFENYSIETADFNYGFTDNIILIDKAPLDIKKFIISKLDKTSGEIKKVYEVKDIKSAEINKLHSEIRNEESEYIVFALNDEILKELTIGTEIKIGKNFSQILKNENTRKHNKRNSELFYKIDKEKKQLLVENRKDVNEIKIITLNNEKINRIYTGNIYLKSNIKTNAVVTFDRNDFNFMQGDISAPYGRIRIYPTSNSDFSAKIGILDTTDEIVTSDRKNGQFLQAKVTGTTYPLQEHHFGKKLSITVGTTKKEISVSTNPNHPVGTQSFGVVDGIHYRLDYQALGISNGGLDISLREWNGKASSVPIKVEFPDGAVSNYTINIPEFEAKNYYNEDLPLANEYLPTKKYTKEIIPSVTGSLEQNHDLDRIRVGIKNYDLSIFGTNSSGHSNFMLKFPKKITLEATEDNGRTQNVTFSVGFSGFTGAIGPTLIKEEGDNYIINPNSNGYKDRNTKMDFDIILTGNIRSNHSLNNLITLKGKNLNLVSIGAVNSVMNKMTTIIDEVEYKINFKNISETIDVSSLKILESLFTNNEFTGLIQNENRIVLKDGITEIFNTTLENLKTTPQQILNAGVAVKYNEATNKFEFIKKKHVDYNRNLKLEIRSSNNLLLYTVNLQLINSIFETNAVVTFDRNDFNLVQGDQAHPYGRIRISSTSNSNFSAKIGITDETDQVVTDNRKNGQFLQGKVTGTTYPLQEHHFGKTLSITVGTYNREVIISNDINANPMGTHSFGVVDGIHYRLDYQPLKISNGGLDIVLREWSGKDSSAPIKIVFPDGAISNYIINIPEFEGKNYYNEDLPLANEYLSTKKYTKEINQFINGELDIIKLGIKDYDLRILGDNSNLRLKVPKEITLEATEDNGRTQNVTFAVSLSGLQNATSSIEGDNYIINPNSNGYRDANSEMTFDVVLTGDVVRNFEVNNLVSLRGDIDLVSIGAVNSGTGLNKMTPIINQVEYKINFKNSSETIDFRDKNKGDIILGNSKFEALDTNKVVLKDKGVTIFDETISELKKGIELPDSGVKITYDVTKKILKFEKIGYKDYSNENLVIELRSKDNLLLRTISLKLYNKVGFEILPGRGVLDFGHFMPGDFKRAESLIEFKNPSGAKISVDLNPINNQNMYKLGVPIAPNTTIPLSNIQIKDLKNGINKTNNFKISGEARTTTTTEVGEYEGKLDVIITIIP